MERVCQQSGEHFYISERELAYCEREGVPPPLVSPRMRIQQLGAFRNRSHLFQSVCAHSGKKILSQFPPARNLVVYDVDIWESDAWSGFDYGREYDFTRPFFEQFAELMSVVPLPNLAVIRSTMENSDYAHGITGGKNLYLVFAASHNEDCYFCRMINRCRNVADSILVEDSELCYECRNVHSCYNLRYSEDCHNCAESAFLVGCYGCRNCYGCVNLRQAEYHFYNEKLSAAEYKARIAAIDLGSYAVVQRELRSFQEYVLKFPRKYYSGQRAEGSSGNFLNNTKNVRDSFFIFNGEDLENCIWLAQSKDCFVSWSYGNGSELLYNCVSCGDKAHNLRFCVDCWPGGHDLEYCIYTGYGSADCFACVGLKRAQYCIFNRRYTKEEYRDLKRRIIASMKAGGEYGRFFPVQFSPFYYNISEASELFPLEAGQAAAAGFTWYDEPLSTEGGTSAYCDHIHELDDSALGKVFACQKTGKPFRLTRIELDFYRKLNIPPPRIAPMERLKLRTSLLRYSPPRAARCASCAAAFLTCYEPSPRPILCETCFQR